MAPDDEARNDASLKPRSRSRGLSGMKRTASNNFINDFPPGWMELCGIYEWKAVGTFRGQSGDVLVYVGSTCRGEGKKGSLKQRVREYGNNGSHKRTLVNEALEKGYELWVRVKTSNQSRVRAEDMENRLLRTYDYPWNVRRNNAIRDILPD